MLNLNFNNIRHVNGSANDGFEEFVCQLAHKESIPYAERFVRNGKPDGGVECYWVLEDGSEVAWQAKYFCYAFDNSQYQQIDRSVKEALNVHPNLKRYIIVAPTDPSDAHVRGRKSMKERIDNHIKNWAVISPHVTFEFWWASDLIERLQKPQNQGILRFWFDKHEFTDDDFLRFNASSIKDLGKRYTPKLNVEVTVSDYFEVLSRGDSLIRYFDKNLNIAECVCKKIEKDNDCHGVQNKIDNVRNTIARIKAIGVTGIEEIPLDDFLTSLLSLVDALENIADKVVDKENVNYEDDIASQKIYEFVYDIINVYNELHQDNIRLVNDPVLILKGDAGVGKSHLIADVVERRTKEKQFSLLFLGQKFVTDEDPFTQMMNMLYFKGSSEDFLEMLEAKAEATGHRIIIFIDAINEGHGLTIWPNSIRGFIDKIRRHPWVGLVLSIRTSYQPAILPFNEFGSDYFVVARHYGFEDKTQKAVKTYFKEYEIFYPSVPLLNPEFKNPLFLHLFCEGMKNNGYKKIPDGIKGITSVMKLFFDGVDKSLRKEKHCSSSIRCVEKAVHEFIDYTTKNKRHEMPIDVALEIFSNIYPRIFNDGELLDGLISEGVFSKNLFRKVSGNDEECIFFTYERFENILQADYLIDELPDSKAFEEYVQMFEQTYQIGGLLESLAILLPERKNLELYDILPHLYNSKVVADSVLSSLIWRDESTIDSHLDSYFDGLMVDNLFKDRFIKTIIEVSFNAGNYYNSDYLHRILSSMQLAKRDAIWIPALYRIYGSSDNIIEEIINWVWDESDVVDINERSVMLGATLLSWFLASTNRKLRDTATKALVQLLHNRMQVLIPLFEKFKIVDDPYIHERLYSVALGCAVRTKYKNQLACLCQYIYSTVFDVEGDVYPHVLLRDYAREVIEYAASIGEKLEFDLNKIRPPYQSSFDYQLVPDEEIRELYDKCCKNTDSRGLYNLLTSMFPEHTKVGFSYGDFGRYTFQNALRSWEIDAESISNLAIKLIIDKYGYKEELHGSFDKVIGSGRGRMTVPNERIGKKYQWLVLHELLARVSDNFPKFESPWNDKIVNYEGPWSPFVRDIDPTTLMRVDKEESNSGNVFWWDVAKYANWDHEMYDWLRLDDAPSVEPIIAVRDQNGYDWLVLECSPDWDEPHEEDEIYKSVWYQVRSCIVDEDKIPAVFNWAESQTSDIGWMPEKIDLYEIFYREYYWSSAYDSYDNVLTRNEFFDAQLTSICYLWEAGEDHSKEIPFSGLIPSKQLFEGMKMRYADEDGVYLNEEGEIICFSASFISESKNYLLVRKTALLDYLKTYHKKILWRIYGEKNIIGFPNHKSVPKITMWPVMNGTYTLDDNGKVVGV